MNKSTLIERLRTGAEGFPMIAEHPSKLMNEAADRLEELEAQLEKERVNSSGIWRLSAEYLALQQKVIELEAQLKTRERTSQLHKDNHLAAERVIKRVRVLCDGWCGGVIFASGLRIERTVSLDQQRCANELDEILEKQDE